MTGARTRSRRRNLAPWRSATAHRRTHATDFALGLVLAFVAGAINAGGFLAIGQYTSHMTGIVATIADDLVMGITDFVAVGMAVLACFIAGAAASSAMIDWCGRTRRARQYVYPVLAEAALIVGFGALGLASARAPFLEIVLMPLLGFMMGLQNATITRISNARIRTTHLTGMVTDIGMELGRLASGNGPDRSKLRIHGGLVASFFVGGLFGAAGFLTLGFAFAFFAALPLVAVALPAMLRRRRV